MDRDDFIELIEDREYLEGLINDEGPTLDRVLYALGDAYGYHRGKIFIAFGPICDRKLLNDDGTSATLRDQSKETKDKIAKLLGV